MTAYFRIVEDPFRDKKEEVTYHVRFSSNGTTSITKLMEVITYGTTYTDADVDGLLSLLQMMFIRALNAGENLTIEGIGTFMPSVECPAGLPKSKINMNNVTLRTIRFRPAAELMNKLSKVKFHRRKECKVPRYTLEQRKAFLLAYLAEHYHITGTLYSRKNYISKTTASKDFKLFVKEGLIAREGKGPTTFYRLK